MSVLLLGLVLFFAIHSVSMLSDGWRDRMVVKLGKPLWQGLYSLVSLTGLLFIVWGYGHARASPIVVYLPPPWLHHVAMLLLLGVFPLLLAAYFPGRIKTAVKHPMITSIKLWALAHLLVNGMLADILLFGSFLLWAVTNRATMKRRESRATPSAPVAEANDWIVIIAGLGLYVAFVLWIHRWLIGVAPLP